MTGHTEWDELAVGHALHALEPGDEQAFVDHLNGCLTCGRTVADAESLASHLAYSAEQVAPPPTLRQAILTEVGQSGRELVPFQLRAERAVRPAGVRRDRSRRAWHPRRPPAWAAAAAAVVAVVSLGFWNTHLRARNELLHDRLALTEEVARAEADPRTNRVFLTSDGGAHGTVLVRDRSAWLVAAGLPRSAGGEMYVLWIRDQLGSATPVQSFRIGSDGVTVVRAFPLEGDLQQLRGMAVSREAAAPVLPRGPSNMVLVGNAAGTGVAA